MDGAIIPGDAEASVQEEQGFKLFSWGNSTFGRLGNGAFADSLAPSSVNTQDNTTFYSVCAGENHSLAISDCGDVFAFGEGRYGQLGQGSGLKSEFPRRVPLPLNVNVDTVAAGSTFSIAASCHEQSVFNLLRSRLKRYLEVSVSNLRKLIRVEKMFPENFLIRVLCRDLELNILKAGRNLQVLEYLRLAGREYEGSVWVWGSGRRGELGLGPGALYAPSPKLLSPFLPSRVLKLSAGRNHVLAVVEGGVLYAWGAGSNGRLGIGEPPQESVFDDYDSDSSRTLGEGMSMGQGAEQEAEGKESKGEAKGEGGKAVRAKAEFGTIDLRALRRKRDLGRHIHPLEAARIQNKFITLKNKAALKPRDLVIPSRDVLPQSYAARGLLNEFGKASASADDKLAAAVKAAASSSGNGQPTSPSSRRKVRARRTSGASSSRSYIEEAKDSNNAESVETSPTKFVKKKRRLNPIAEHTQWRAAQGAGQSFNGAKHILDRCSPCLVRGPWELADDRVISVAAGGAHSMVVTAPSGGSSLRFVGSERTPRLRCRRVWGFGKNHRGQLGLGHQQDVYVPKEVTLLREYGAEHPHGLKLTGPAMKRLDLSMVLKEREEKAEKAKQLEKERLAIVQKLERERLEQKSSEESTDEELPDFLQSGSERNDTATDTKEEEAKSSAKASDTPEGSERPDSGGTHSDKASQLSKKGETARDSTHFDRDAPAEDAADGNPAVLQSLDVLEDLKNVKRNIWDPDGWEHARDDVQDGNLKVLEVSLGADHSLVLAEPLLGTGSPSVVLACGDAAYGQCASSGGLVPPPLPVLRGTSASLVGHPSKYITLPTPIPGLRKEEIVQISTGHRTSFAVSREGLLFSWGVNQFGQTGVGDRGIHMQPTVVPALRQWQTAKVAAGATHALAIGVPRVQRLQRLFERDREAAERAARAKREEDVRLERVRRRKKKEAERKAKEEAQRKADEEAGRLHRAIYTYAAEMHEREEERRRQMALKRSAELAEQRAQARRAEFQQFLGTLLGRGEGQTGESQEDQSQALAPTKSFGLSSKHTWGPVENTAHQYEGGTEWAEWFEGGGWGSGGGYYAQDESWEQMAYGGLQKIEQEMQGYGYGQGNGYSEQQSPPDNAWSRVQQARADARRKREAREKAQAAVRELTEDAGRGDELAHVLRPKKVPLPSNWPKSHPPEMPNFNSTASQLVSSSVLRSPHQVFLSNPHPALAATLLKNRKGKLRYVVLSSPPSWVTASLSLPKPLHNCPALVLAVPATTRTWQQVGDIFGLHLDGKRHYLANGASDNGSASLLADSVDESEGAKGGSELGEGTNVPWSPSSPGSPSTRGFFGKSGVRSLKHMSSFASSPSYGIGTYITDSPGQDEIPMGGAPYIVPFGLFRVGLDEKDDSQDGEEQPAHAASTKTASPVLPLPASLDHRDPRIPSLGNLHVRFTGTVPFQQVPTPNPGYSLYCTWSRFWQVAKYLRVRGFRVHVRPWAEWNEQTIPIREHNLQSLKELIDAADNVNGSQVGEGSQEEEEFKDFEEVEKEEEEMAQKKLIRAGKGEVYEFLEPIENVTWNKLVSPSFQGPTYPSGEPTEPLARLSEKLRSKWVAEAQQQAEVEKKYSRLYREQEANSEADAGMKANSKQQAAKRLKKLWADAKKKRKLRAKERRLQYERTIIAIPSLRSQKGGGKYWREDGVQGRGVGRGTPPSRRQIYAVRQAVNIHRLPNGKIGEIVWRPQLDPPPEAVAHNAPRESQWLEALEKKEKALRKQQEIKDKKDEEARRMAEMREQGRLRREARMKGVPESSLVKDDTPKDEISQIESLDWSKLSSQPTLALETKAIPGLPKAYRRPPNPHYLGPRFLPLAGWEEDEKEWEEQTRRAKLINQLRYEEEMDREEAARHKAEKEAKRQEAIEKAKRWANFKSAAPSTDGSSTTPQSPSKASSAGQSSAKPGRKASVSSQSVANEDDAAIDAAVRANVKKALRDVRRYKKKKRAQKKGSSSPKAKAKRKGERKSSLAQIAEGEEDTEHEEEGDGTATDNEVGGDSSIEDETMADLQGEVKEIDSPGGLQGEEGDETLESGSQGSSFSRKQELGGIEEKPSLDSTATSGNDWGTFLEDSSEDEEEEEDEGLGSSSLEQGNRRIVVFAAKEEHGEAAWESLSHGRFYMAVHRHSPHGTLQSATALPPSAQMAYRSLGLNDVPIWEEAWGVQRDHSSLGSKEDTAFSRLHSCEPLRPEIQKLVNALNGKVKWVWDHELGGLVVQWDLRSLSSPGFQPRHQDRMVYITNFPEDPLLYSILESGDRSRQLKDLGQGSASSTLFASRNGNYCFTVNPRYFGFDVVKARGARRNDPPTGLDAGSSIESAASGGPPPPVRFHLLLKGSSVGEIIPCGPHQPTLVRAVRPQPLARHEMELVVAGRDWSATLRSSWRLHKTLLPLLVMQLPGTTLKTSHYRVPRIAQSRRVPQLPLLPAPGVLPPPPPEEVKPFTLPPIRRLSEKDRAQGAFAMKVAEASSLVAGSALWAGVQSMLPAGVYHEVASWEQQLVGHQLRQLFVGVALQVSLPEVVASSTEEDGRGSSAMQHQGRRTSVNPSRRRSSVGVGRRQSVSGRRASVSGRRKSALGMPSRFDEGPLFAGPTAASPATDSVWDHSVAEGLETAAAARLHGNKEWYLCPPPPSIVDEAGCLGRGNAALSPPEQLTWDLQSWFTQHLSDVLQERKDLKVPLPAPPSNPNGSLNVIQLVTNRVLQHVREIGWARVLLSTRSAVENTIMQVEAEELERKQEEMERALMAAEDLSLQFNPSEPGLQDTAETVAQGREPPPESKDETMDSSSKPFTLGTELEKDSNSSSTPASVRVRAEDIVISQLDIIRSARKVLPEAVGHVFGVIRELTMRSMSRAGLHRSSRMPVNSRFRAFQTQFGSLDKSLGFLLGKPSGVEGGDVAQALPSLEGWDGREFVQFMEENSVPEVVEDGKEHKTRDGVPSMKRANTFHRRAWEKVGVDSHLDERYTHVLIKRLTKLPGALPLHDALVESALLALPPASLTAMSTAEDWEAEITQEMELMIHEPYGHRHEPFGYDGTQSAAGTLGDEDTGTVHSTTWSDVGDARSEGAPSIAPSVAVPPQALRLGEGGGGHGAARTVTFELEPDGGESVGQGSTVITAWDAASRSSYTSGAVAKSYLPSVVEEESPEQFRRQRVLLLWKQLEEVVLRALNAHTEDEDENPYYSTTFSETDHPHGLTVEDTDVTGSSMYTSAVRSMLDRERRARGAFGTLQRHKQQQRNFGGAFRPGLEREAVEAMERRTSEFAASAASSAMDRRNQGGAAQGSAAADRGSLRPLEWTQDGFKISAALYTSHAYILQPPNSLQFIPVQRSTALRLHKALLDVGDKLRQVQETLQRESSKRAIAKMMKMKGGGEGLPSLTGPSKLGDDSAYGVSFEGQVVPSFKEVELQKRREEQLKKTLKQEEEGGSRFETVQEYEQRLKNDIISSAKAKMDEVLEQVDAERQSNQQRMKAVHARQQFWRARVNAEATAQAIVQPVRPPVTILCPRTRPAWYNALSAMGFGAYPQAHHHLRESLLPEFASSAPAKTEELAHPTIDTLLDDLDPDNGDGQQEEDEQGSDEEQGLLGIQDVLTAYHQHKKQKIEEEEKTTLNVQGMDLNSDMRVAALKAAGATEAKVAAQAEAKRNVMGEDQTGAILPPSMMLGSKKEQNLMTSYAKQSGGRVVEIERKMLAREVYAGLEDERDVEAIRGLQLLEDTWVDTGRSDAVSVASARDKGAVDSKASSQQHKASGAATTGKKARRYQRLIGARKRNRQGVKIREIHLDDSLKKALSTVRPWPSASLVALAKREIVIQAAAEQAEREHSERLSMFNEDERIGEWKEQDAMFEEDTRVLAFSESLRYSKFVLDIDLKKWSERKKEIEKRERWEERQAYLNQAHALEREAIAAVKAKLAGVSAESIEAAKNLARQKVRARRKGKMLLSRHGGKSVVGFEHEVSSDEDEEEGEEGKAKVWKKPVDGALVRGVPIAKRIVEKGVIGFKAGAGQCSARRGLKWAGPSGRAMKEQDEKFADRYPVKLVYEGGLTRAQESAQVRRRNTLTRIRRRIERVRERDRKREADRIREAKLIITERRRKCKRILQEWYARQQEEQDKKWTKKWALAMRLWEAEKSWYAQSWLERLEQWRQEDEEYIRHRPYDAEKVRMRRARIVTAIPVGYGAGLRPPEGEEWERIALMEPQGLPLHVPETKEKDGGTKPKNQWLAALRSTRGAPVRAKNQAVADVWNDLERLRSEAPSRAGVYIPQTKEEAVLLAGLVCGQAYVVPPVRAGIPLEDNSKRKGGGGGAPSPKKDELENRMVSVHQVLKSIPSPRPTVGLPRYLPYLKTPPTQQEQARLERLFLGPSYNGPGPYKCLTCQISVMCRSCARAGHRGHAVMELTAQEVSELPSAGAILSDHFGLGYVSQQAISRAKKVASGSSSPREGSVGGASDGSEAPKASVVVDALPQALLNHITAQLRGRTAHEEEGSKPGEDAHTEALIQWLLGTKEFQERRIYLCEYGVSPECVRPPCVLEEWGEGEAEDDAEHEGDERKGEDLYLLGLTDRDMEWRRHHVLKIPREIESSIMLLRKLKDLQARREAAKEVKTAFLRRLGLLQPDETIDRIYEEEAQEGESADSTDSEEEEKEGRTDAQDADVSREETKEVFAAAAGDSSIPAEEEARGEETTEEEQVHGQPAAQPPAAAPPAAEDEPQRDSVVYF